VLFYDNYADVEAAEQLITENADKIQCVVSGIRLNISNQVVNFGQSQQPKLWDYADGIDTMDFLAGL
jgi:hypothetical protein